MSPGSDSDHPRTRRFVSYKCMFCHNGIPQIPPGHEASGSDPVYVGDLPEGIDCQRCHGPGGKHVQMSGTRASIVNPAVNQFDNCLRCHGTGSGKIVNAIAFGYLPARLVFLGDPLNVIPQFVLTASSSHPVMHDRSSTLSQPSLRTQMLQLDGTTLGRSMGTRIFCTDCHNADDNREFGGAGPNGPHGSKYAQHPLQVPFGFANVLRAEILQQHARHAHLSGHALGEKGFAGADRPTGEIPHGQRIGAAGFQKLRVFPKASDSVQGKIASSGRFVLPITIAPASRRRRTCSESAFTGSP